MYRGRDEWRSKAEYEETMQICLCVCRVIQMRGEDDGKEEKWRKRSVKRRWRQKTRVIERGYQVWMSRGRARNS